MDDTKNKKIIPLGSYRGPSSQRYGFSSGHV